MEFGNHAWGGEAKVVSAHVVGCVQKADRDPVQTASFAKASGMDKARRRCTKMHALNLISRHGRWNRKEGDEGVTHRVELGMDLSIYRHLIWDWNGTLLDDAWLCREIMNGQLRKRGLPTLSAERYEAIFDFPVEGYYRKVGFDWNKESFEEAGTEFIVEYEKRKTECRLQVGAKELLKRVESAGLSQAVLSAYSHGSLEKSLGHFGVRSHFKSVAGSRNHYAEGKVEHGLRMLQELHVSPSETLLIGDTTHDAEVAHAMGVGCVLIPCGHNSRDRLARCRAEVVNGLGELRIGVEGRKTSP